jgi:hypothetical protein
MALNVATGSHIVNQTDDRMKSPQPQAEPRAIPQSLRLRADRVIE